jgi:ABC-2 type transport system ATP-binding protein
MPLVEIAQVHKSFGKVQAMDEVSFTVEPGEIFGLLGSNGAGKTTIRMLLDIFQPDGGSRRARAERDGDAPGGGRRAVVADRG